MGPWASPARDEHCSVASGGGDDRWAAGGRRVSLILTYLLKSGHSFNNFYLFHVKYE